MDAGMIADVLRDAVTVAIKLGGPMLILSKIGRASCRESV